jgi:acyl-CoA thioesterase
LTAHLFPAWGGVDIAELFAVEDVGPLRFRTLCGDANANANANGRAYGGQVLAQALTAAAHTVP